VAKKRRAQEVAGMRVKCSLSVASGQQSWRGSNLLAARSLTSMNVCPD
jgi:hypothetical protein